MKETIVVEGIGEWEVTQEEWERLKVVLSEERKESLLREIEKVEKERAGNDN